jgi:glycogen(starch) synthase
MRILAVSNYYPPHHIGGYELGCKDVISGLVERGHEVSVLTSTHGVGGPHTSAGVHRRLHAGGLSTLPKSNLLEAVTVEFRDHRILTRLVSQLKPQLISVWNLADLADSLTGTIQRLKIPAIYHLSDDWLIHKLHRNLWRRVSHRRSKQVGKAVLRLMLGFLLPESLLPDPGDLRLRDCHFTSKALKEQYLGCGLPVSSANVIYWGIPLDTYVPGSRTSPNNGVKLLFVGQLEKHKGVHTAVQAVAKLVNKKAVKSARLTIVGAGKDREYDRRLTQTVIDANMQRHVEFLGRVPRDSMPNIYNEHDILVFPSVWEEPFSLTLLEAMACGLAVVATTTGGSKEILVDGWNSLTFRAEHPDELAAQLERVIENERLRQYLSENAVETVKSRFDITHMVDQIEDLFMDAITQPMTEVAS